MDRKHLEKFIKDQYQNIYSFSYALVPDELQAQQIALDALDLLMNREDKLMRDIVFAQEKPRVLLRQLTIKYYASVFEIGSKRFEQIKGGIEIKVDRSAGSFYALGLGERAVMFAKMILKLDLNEIEQITQHTRYEILSILNQSREYLLSNNAGRSVRGPRILGAEH